MALAQDAMDEARVAHQKQIDQLEQRMPLGPHRAQKLGMKIQWQFESPHPIVHFFPADDSVYLINHHNELSRVDGQKGTLRWHTHGGTRADQIIDVIALNDLDRILVLRSTSILTVAKSTGNPASIGEARGSRQPLEWLAATPGVVNGPFLIYGGLGGELSWQGYTHGFTEAAHRIGRRIETTPVLVGNLVIAASHSGDVYGLDANTRRTRWMTPLLGKPVGQWHCWTNSCTSQATTNTCGPSTQTPELLSGPDCWKPPSTTGPLQWATRSISKFPSEAWCAWKPGPNMRPKGKKPGPQRTSPAMSSRATAAC
jgi:hypothetical protein